MSASYAISDIQKLIASESGKRLLPIGARTKFALAAEVESGLATPIPSGELRGIVAYDPSEFLITVRSGTPLSELQSALAEHQQYMPFDPQFSSVGGTIGGTIASGINGPGCLLYGGLRDFLMEVKLIDGLGKLVVAGGKVVKNAAGFDLPKLVVGSYGRLGFLTEVTLKVLPQPQGVAKCEVEHRSLEACVAAIQKLRNAPLPITAIDYSELGRLTALFAGPMDSLEATVKRSADVVKCDWDSHQLSQAFSGPALVNPSAAFQIRVAMDLTNSLQLARSLQEIAGVEIQTFTCGGSMAILSVANANCFEDLDRELTSLGLSAVAIQGPFEALTVLGNRNWIGPASRIQRAIDPRSRFVGYPASSGQSNGQPG